jgi:hypothetical protein
MKTTSRVPEFSPDRQEKTMINISPHGVKFALLEAQLLAGEAIAGRRDRPLRIP